MKRMLSSSSPLGGCFLLSCAIAVAAALLSGCASAAAVSAGEVPVLPAPRRVGSAGTQARAVAADGLSLALDGACSGECADVVRGAFDRVVRGAFAAQRGLSRWRLSLHAEVDAPPPPDPTPGLAPLATLRVVFDAAAAVAGATGGGGGANDGEEGVLPELRASRVEDEWHELQVGAAGDAVLRVRSAWGALRGFETVAQLCEWDDGNVRFVVGRLPLVVEDWPRFPWRGLMVDTARHFLPLAKLKQLVDAAAAMKLNVLHVHLTDAQSFPLVIEAVPGLSGRGAFSPKAVYTHEDVADLIAHARTRGVMVVPEIDIPAHTGSWRFADPDLVADCWKTLIERHGVYMENVLPLNPASTKTWDTITKVLGEVAAVFTGPYLHVGGDEVSTYCWEDAKQRAAIDAWMAEHKITDFKDITKFFDRFTQNVTRFNKKTPVVWEDVYTSGALLNEDTLVHVWRSTSLLAEVVKDGYNAILSYGYYQDRQSPLCSGNCPTYWMFSWTYRDMYNTDPTLGLGLTPAEEDRVLGGEACIWGESVDQVNLDQIDLTRAVAVAERFWSNSNVTNYLSLEWRSQRWRCLAVRRGVIASGPLSTDYCEVPWPLPSLPQTKPATLPPPPPPPPATTAAVEEYAETDGGISFAWALASACCGGALALALIAAVAWYRSAAH